MASFSDYVYQLKVFKDRWNQNNNDTEAIAQAKALKERAASEGIDIVALEKEAWLQTYGKEMTIKDLEAAKSSMRTTAWEQRFIDQIAACKVKYTNARTDVEREAISRQANTLRKLAFEQGFNLLDLENKAQVKATGKPVPANLMNGVNQNIASVQMGYYAEKLANLKRQYNATNDPNEQAKIHAQAQELRLIANKYGVNLMALEDMAQYQATGKYLTPQQKQDVQKMIDNLLGGRPSTRPPDIPELPSGGGKGNDSLGVNLNYGTFSGSDMVVFLGFPGAKPIEVGTATTFSYTTYRETKQVRTLGRISAKGIVKGGRTISGKLIFTVINQHIVEDIRNEIEYLREHDIILMDELPPFDLIISFGNEYGKLAGMIVQGIATVDEQKNFSIEDLFTENIFTYLARRLEPMRSSEQRINDIYDPSKWIASSLRNKDSELVGNFNVNDLLLFDTAAELRNLQSLTSPPESWHYDNPNQVVIDTGGQVGGVINIPPPITTPPPPPKNKKNIAVQVVGNDNGMNSVLTSGVVKILDPDDGNKELFREYIHERWRGFGAPQIDNGYAKFINDGTMIMKHYGSAVGTVNRTAFAAWFSNKDLANGKRVVVRFETDDQSTGGWKSIQFPKQITFDDYMVFRITTEKDAASHTKDFIIQVTTSDRKWNGVNTETYSGGYVTLRMDGKPEQRFDIVEIPQKDLARDKWFNGNSFDQNYGRFIPAPGAAYGDLRLYGARVDNFSVEEGKWLRLMYYDKDGRAIKGASWTVTRVPYKRVLIMSQPNEVIT